MKVLYIGHYREQSGVGRAAREFIHALNTTDVDVVCRPIKLNDTKVEVDDVILKCEEKSSQNCDICIQNLLPHHLSYSGHFQKNIAQFLIEGIGYKNHPWYYQIETMDEAWIANYSTECPNIPNCIIPLPCNLELYKANYERLNIPELKGNYVFYVIADWTRRKNIASLLLAFHTEFHKSEPVSVVIKTSKFGASPQELSEEVGKFCAGVKNKLSLYKKMEDYHSEVVITQYLRDSDIMALHKTCNCFVSSSYGEAWSYPTFDAMAMGNFVISPNEGGPKDYVAGFKAGMLVHGDYEPCFDGKAAFEHILTGRQQWYKVNINALRKAMRYAFENRIQSKELGLEQAKKYSYEKIGQIMYERLMA